MENIEDISHRDAASLVDLVASMFGRRVREVRERRGLTQAELARAMSMSGKSFHQTTMAKLESGSRPTTIGEATLLATLLQVEVADLLDPPAGKEFRMLATTLTDQHIAELEAELVSIRESTRKIEETVQSLRTINSFGVTDGQH